MKYTDLRPETRQAIIDYIKSHTTNWDVSLEDDKGFLEKHFNKWKGAVSEVENGYRGSVFDYVEDIDRRGYLGGAIEAGGDELSPLRREIEGLDARFFRATKEIYPIVEPDPLNEKWISRVPIAASEMLHRQIENEYKHNGLMRLDESLMNLLADPSP